MKSPISLLPLILISSPTWAELVPVLKTPLARGQVIAADNITLQDVDKKHIFASTPRQIEGVIGQQATRNINAGEPLNKLHLRVPPVVERNSTITITYQRGGIQLSGQGQALEDGTLGQSIKVLNPATRATLLGTISAPGQVSVN